MTRTTLGAASAVLALAACGDGQTESDYRGEPLMSLRGVVTSSQSALSASLVPALEFVSTDDRVASNGGTFTTYFVKSEVEGTFPSSFTMRLYEPPPDGALTRTFDGEPAFNFGNLTAVSPEHPGWLRKEAIYEDIEEDGVVIGNQQREELCADTGECISGYAHDCSSEDPSAQWPCGPHFPDNLPWETYGYSDTYALLYLDAEAPAGSVLATLLGLDTSVPAGYHAARFINPITLPPEQAAARNQCVREAMLLASEVTKAIYGITMEDPNNTWFAPLDIQLELNRQTQIAQADLGCQSLWELIADPASEPLDLSFTDQPERHSF